MQNKKKWIAITVSLLLVTNLLTFYFGGNVSVFKGTGRVEISRSDYDQYKEYSKMFGIKSLLYKYYDGKISESVLTEGAIKGMTSALNDPYTVFMNKKEYEDFNTQTEGNYSGLGIQVKVKDDNIVVVGTFDESPAKVAGILPDDIIEKVDGKAVSGKELDNAVTMMKGLEGTSVTLTLMRQNKGEFDLKLKRAKINMQTVKGEMLKDGIGYIQITMFDENTGDNFNKTLKDLESKGMKKLVLDLRGNPGGLLDQCVNVVSNFIPKDKIIVYTVNKNGKRIDNKSKGGDAINMPLVLLVDEGSASASEIVSGAVRDYKIGTLIGKNTFGKGIVQTIIETGDGTALKVTIAKYYSPNGENIQGKGIKPDIEVEYPNELRQKEYSRENDPQFIKALDTIKEMK